MRELGRGGRRSGGAIGQSSACRSDKFIERSVDFFENVRCAREEVEEEEEVVVVVEEEEAAAAAIAEPHIQHGAPREKKIYNLPELKTRFRTERQ